MGNFGFFSIFFSLPLPGEKKNRETFLMLFTFVFISLANLLRKINQKPPKLGPRLHFVCMDVDTCVSVA